MHIFIQRHVTPLSKGVYSLLERFLPAREEFVRGGWISNKTGQMSFRAHAFLFLDDKWEIAVLCRFGNSEAPRYEWCRIDQKGRYRRKNALREANRLAEQLATLRYRFSVDFAN